MEKDDLKNRWLQYALQVQYDEKDFSESCFAARYTFDLNKIKNNKLIQAQYATVIEYFDYIAWYNKTSEKIYVYELCNNITSMGNLGHHTDVDIFVFDSLVQMEKWSQSDENKVIFYDKTREYVIVGNKTQLDKELPEKNTANKLHNKI